MQYEDIPEITEEGYKDLLEGKVTPFEEAMENIRKELNLDSCEENFSQNK